ncbi:AMP-binding protein [Yoonia sp. 208BN28-4]|uniref:AMP-binding protein n=1 Tax=Yoonia sp. 208BN28-4 TaxID=3126505 RepID=UPI0030AAB0B4
MTDTLLTAFAQAVAAHGPDTALVDADGRDISFDQLDARARALAAAWASRGMGQGDRILIAMPIGPDLYASLAAIWSLGAVAVLPEPAMGLAGLRNAIATAGVTGICASGGYRALKLLPALWRVPLFTPQQTGGGGVGVGKVNAEDLALISFTSGSTGKPKAIPRSHGFLMAQHDAVAPLLQSAKAERDLVAFPVFVLINLAAGRTSILPNWKMSQLDRVTPHRLTAWMDSTGATRALLPPALCETLVNGDVPRGLHTLFTGGGPVFPDLVARLTHDGQLGVTAVYGSTEAEPIAHLETATMTAKDVTAMQGGAGLLAGAPVPAVAVRIVDDEIQVAGDHVNAGYLDPAHNAENKVRDGDTIWHRTGDAGYLDDQGRLWLLGRHGSAVQTDQGPLYPFAIETAARLWPGVDAAALVPTSGGGILAIAGQVARLPDWVTAAAAFGITDVRHCASLPMDRRHRSKIDLKRLRKQLGVAG